MLSEISEFSGYDSMTVCECYTNIDFCELLLCRFHLLAEFDEGKRSCRKRLAGHNERRRKPQFDSHWGNLFSANCPGFVDYVEVSKSSMLDLAFSFFKIEFF